MATKGQRPIFHPCRKPTAPGIWVNIEWRAGVLRLAVPQGRDHSLHAPAELVPTENELKFRVQGTRRGGNGGV